jgi:hypothetical protein
LLHLFWNCGILYSFYVTKPPYSLSFNEPDYIYIIGYYTFLQNIRFIQFNTSIYCYIHLYTTINSCVKLNNFYTS